MPADLTPDLRTEALALCEAVLRFAHNDDPPETACGCITCQAWKLKSELDSLREKSSAPSAPPSRE